MNSLSFMKEALRLAQANQGFTAPNPPVGAVIYRGGHILSLGSHLGAGTPHAEIQAIDRALEKGLNLSGAHMAVTLEPCWQDYPGKRTPPCVPRIVASGISRILVGALDPHPMVAGKGIQALKAAGLEVDFFPPDLAQSCNELLVEFRVWVGKGRPYFHLKWAQSLDGRLADSQGRSQWITGPEARRQSHLLRAENVAVMVGAGTLRSDNPSLTVRHVPGPQPRRLVLGGAKSLDPHSQIFHDTYKNLTWLILGPDHPDFHHWKQVLENRVIAWDGEDWEALGKELLEKGFYTILAEGGSTLLSALLARGWWDRVTVFTAPKIIGSGPTVGEPGQGLSDCFNFSQGKLSQAGDDGRWDVYRTD